MSILAKYSFLFSFDVSLILCFTPAVLRNVFGIFRALIYAFNSRCCLVGSIEMTG